MPRNRSQRVWCLLGLGVMGLILGGAIVGGIPSARASEADEPFEQEPAHCTICGEHLHPIQPEVQRYRLHNTVVSLDRRNRSDPDHNAYQNVLRLDTQTGRAWILRPNQNLAGFSWVLVPNYPDD